MTARFTRHGSAVRLHGDPFATCVDEIAAMMVLNALVALDEQAGRAHVDRILPTIRPGDTLTVPGEIISATFSVPGPSTAQHICMRQSDEFSCSCGLRWGIDEPDPH